MLQGSGMLALLCCLLHVHSSLATSLPVPLLTWSSKSQPQAQASFATPGHSQKLDSIFQDRIKPTLDTKSLVLLFVQDELSSDDFVKYSSSFPHIQKVMDTHKYDFYPSVSKESSLSELVSGAVSDVELVDSSSLNEWKYNGKKNVVVFNLEPVAGSSSKGRGDILKNNDHVMHLITKTLKQEGKEFNVVYTAEEPSQLVANFLLNEEIADATFGSRHLLASNGTEQKIFNNTCVLMYATSITFTDGDNEAELIRPGADWKVGGCGAKGVGCSISLEQAKAPDGLKDVTLLMEIRNDTQDWYCNILRLSYTNSTSNASNVVEFNCGANSSYFEQPVYNSIRAPLGMSYSCHDMTFIQNTSVLTLGGLQLQSLCDGNPVGSSFHGAFHCVGFFTIPILTGIFVTVVLMLGLYIGIMMMMAIQVQDRYDDPKGKTISVSTAGNAD